MGRRKKRIQKIGTCSRKKHYSTKEDAEKAARSLRTIATNPINVYRCSVCKLGWLVGSTNKWR